jgi:DNA-binding CsgD family transcriptional regulator
LLGDEGPDSATPYRAAATLALADHYDEASEASARGLDDARLRASALGVTLASVAAADADLRRGRLADAEAHARTALDLTRESSLLAIFVPFAVSAVVECEIERGELEGSERLLVRHRFDGLLEASGAGERVLLARARLRLAQGRFLDGIADLRTLAKTAEFSGVANPAALPWRSTLAPVLARRGEQEEARALATQELELAERWGAPRTLGIALRAAGETQHGEPSIALLERSVTVLDASPARLEHARAIVSLGSALRREGRRSEARTVLARGVKAAERQTASSLAEQAGAELRVAGARPQRTRLSGVESLTASERRVVQIASDGATNREIAESLWLSVKTVEMHLHNAFRKLDVGSRRELAGALERVSAARP